MAPDEAGLPGAVIMAFMRLTLLLLGLIACVSCSPSNKQAKAATAGPAIPAHFTATNTSNELAKYIELVGLRIRERSPGHLVIQFGVVNHSEADIGDMKLTVNLSTSAAKPGDPPLITFPAQVSKLGPTDLKDVSVEVPTKMRVYELPDWQFLTASFSIDEPQ
jgi:hypothetical protein